MTLILYKIIAASLIFFISIATIIQPIRKKSSPVHSESIHLGDALASGIFLGAAFFHMLPDSTHLFENVYGALSYPLPALLCVAGFLLLLFLERLSLSYSVQHAKHPIPYLLTCILIIHALIEGAALGIGDTLTETTLLLIAILAHKGSESFALCITLLKHQLSLSRTICILIFFACMTPLGITLGNMLQILTFAKHGELLAAIFNAFAAGTFLYISTLHHLHFHQHKTAQPQGFLEFASLVTGVVVMAVIALWA